MDLKQHRWPPKKWQFCRCCMIHLPLRNWVFCILNSSRISCALHIRRQKTKFIAPSFSIRPFFFFFFSFFFPHLAVVVPSKWRSALRVRGGTAGQTPAGKVKLNRAKQASRMMPFINGNIGANWRAELRGGPSGCERESQTESEGRKERRDEVEGDSARGGGGLTARPLQLLHYWSGAKWERGQSLRKKKKLKKRKEHTQRRLRTSARKQDKPGA